MFKIPILTYRLKEKLFKSELSKLEVHEVGKLLDLEFGEIMARLWKIQNKSNKNMFQILAITNHSELETFPGPNYRLKEDDQLIVLRCLDAEWEDFIEELLRVKPVAYVSTMPKQE